MKNKWLNYFTPVFGGVLSMCLWLSGDMVCSAMAVSAGDAIVAKEEVQVGEDVEESGVTLETEEPMVTASVTKVLFSYPRWVGEDSTESYLEAGEIFEPYIYVEPTGAGTSLTWTSSNPAIASVDSAGKLTTIAPGYVTITATAPNGISYSETYEVRAPYNGYVGNINTELMSFDLKQTGSGAYYLTGEIVVVEWVNGASTVPAFAPTMLFKSTDGTEEIEVFVTATGTNTYYFDRFIEGLSLDKEYVFEITSGASNNYSLYRSMNVLLSTSPKMISIRNLGKIGEQKISYYQADNGELRLFRRSKEYVANINSELLKTELVTGPNGNYVSGQIVVVDWENGVSTVPLETPIMYFKSTDGKESLPVFVTPTGTNTYYFDRSLGDLDTSKEYVFTIESGDSLNVSPYRTMIVTTAAMTNKTGTLWESSTQYVKYRTDANTGELRIYGVNK